MFKKLLASVGIGGASVETVLDNPDAMLGEPLTGSMHVKGGSVDQEIAEVAVEVMTRVLVETDNTEVKKDFVVSKVRLANGFKLPAGSSHTLPFELDLPLHTPVALGREHAPAWLRTRLDIPMAADATDADALAIRPAPVQVDALNAMISLGFGLYKSDVEHRPRWHGGHGFVQEFEFRPVVSGGRRLYDEVELVFEPAGDGFDLLLQLDRSSRSLSGFLAEATGMDESWHRLHLDEGLLGPGEDAIARALKQVLFR